MGELEVIEALCCLVERAVSVIRDEQTKEALLPESLLAASPSAPRMRSLPGSSSEYFFKASGSINWVRSTYSAAKMNNVENGRKYRVRLPAI